MDSCLCPPALQQSCDSKLGGGVETQVAGNEPVTAHAVHQDYLPVGDLMLG